jgi:gliding motility-associated-like protein
MRKFTHLFCIGIFVFSFFLTENKVFAQPTITSVTTTPAGCAPGPCNRCPGTTIGLSLSGTDLPAGATVEWMRSTNPAFDPYTSGTLSATGTITNTYPTAAPGTTCPQMSHIQIDACVAGAETNEFVIFSSGSGFPVNSFEFIYNSTNTAGGGANSSVTPGGCNLTTPSAAVVNAIRAACPCNDVQGVGPGGTIPPDSRVLFSVSSNMDPNVYNFSNLCGNGERIRILQSACNRTGGAFTNQPSAASTQTLITQGCSQTVIYPAYSVFGDGTYASVNGGTATIVNGTCPLVIPTQPPLGITPHTSNAGPNNFTIPLGICPGGGTFYIKPRIVGLPASCRPTAPPISFVVDCPLPVASNNGPACPGGNIQLTGSGGTSYQWSGPNGFNSTQQNPLLTNVDASMAGVYTLTVISSTGCVSLTPASTTVVINSGSIPTLTLANNGPLCPGQPLTLTVSPVVPGATFTFTGPGGFSATQTGTTVTVSSSATVAMAGVYSVTASLGGCTSAPATTSVTISPPPAPVGLTATNPICEGQALSLTVTNPVPGATYTFTGPNGYSVTTSATTVQVSASATLAMSGTYSVVANVGGCTSSPSTVPVAVVPGATVGWSTPAVSICQGSSTTLTINFTGTGPFGGVYTTNPLNPLAYVPFTVPVGNTFSIPVSPATTTTYYIMSGGPSGGGSCPGSITISQVVVTVTPNPIPTATATPNQLCAGGVLNLGVTPPGVSYNWSGPGPFSSSVQNPTIPSVPANGGGTYTVTVTYGPSCTNTASVLVNVFPSATSSLTSASICQNGGVQSLSTLLNLTPVGTSGVWSGSTGISGSNFNPTGLTGVQNITFTPSNICISPSSATITITPNITAPLGTAPPQCNTPPLTLLNLTTLLPPSPPAGTWSGTGVLGNVFSPIGLTPGPYTVTFTPTGLCAIPTTTIVTVIGGGTPVLLPGSVCSGGTLNLTTLQSPLFPTGTWSGPGVTGTTFNSAGQSSPTTLTFTPTGTCAGPGTTNVVINPAPSATISSTASVCSGNPSSITVNFTGTGPFTFNINANGVPGPSITTTNNPYTTTLIPAVNTTYTISGLTANGCPGTSSSSSLTSVISGNASISGSASVCSGQLVNIPVALTGPGPFTLIYTVNGVTQNASIPAGATTFNIALNPTITTTVILQNLSIGLCTVTASGTFVANIITAGTPVLLPGSVCAGSTLNLTTLQDPNFPSGTWGGPGVTGNTFNPLGQPASVVLTFTPSGACASPATTTVTTGSGATATISGSGSICQGDPRTLSISFVGAGPYTFRVSANGVPGPPITTSSNPYTFNVSPSVTTNYTITSFTTPGCNGTPNGTATVTITAGPTASIFSSASGCANQPLNIPVTLTGPGPFVLTYSIGGVTQPNVNIPAGTTTYNIVLTPTGPTNVTLINITTGSCTGNASGTTFISITTTGTPNLRRDTLCFTNTPFSLSNLLDPSFPNGAWSGPGVVGNNFIPTNTGLGLRTITFTPTGCGSPASTTILVVPVPTATISGGGTVCLGDSVTLTLNFTGGIPPYNVTVSNGSTTVSRTSNTSPLTIRVRTTSLGTSAFNITQFSNGACSGTFSGSAPTTVNQGSTPNLTTPSPICASAAPINLFSFQDPAFPTGTWSSTTPGAIVGSTFNPIGLSGLIPLTFSPVGSCVSPATVNVQVNQSPSATISGSTTICQGSGTPIGIFILGTPPFTFTYTNGSTPVTVTNHPTSNFSFQVNPSTNTNYTLTNVSSNGCTGSIGGNAQINISTPITYSDLLLPCNSTASYQIIFDVAGGVSPYVVSGVTGSLVGNRFTSDPIPNNTPVSLVISDSGPCPDVNLDLNKNCSCTINPGTLAAGFSNCVGAPVGASFGTPPTLPNPGDRILYVLSSTPIPNSSTVLEASTIPNFGWNPATLLAGVTYYIIGVAFNGVNPFPIIWADPCISFTNAIPVIFYPLPTATFGRDTSVCAGNSANLVYNLAGNEPFSIFVSNGAGSTTYSNIASGPGGFSVSPTGNSVFRLDSIQDTRGCKSRLSLSARITVNPLPTALFSPTSLDLCTGDPINADINVTGIPPMKIAYGPQGGPFNDTLRVSTPGISSISITSISATTTFQIPYIVDANGCTNTGNTLLARINPAPSGNLTGGGNLCSQDSASLLIQFSGNPPFRVDITDPLGSSFTVNNITGTSVTIRRPVAAPGGTFTLTSVRDSGPCRGQATGTATFNVTATPTVNNIVTNCDANQNFTVSFNIAGGDISTYQVIGNPGNLIGNTFTSNPLPSGTNYNFVVSDGNACGNVPVIGTFSCGCGNAVGTMNPGPLRICNPGTTPANLLTSGNTLTPADSFFYVLHTNPGTTLGSIIGTYNTSAISFGPGMTLGTTYYLSAVVIRKVAGVLDFNNPCSLVSAGTAMTFFDSPMGNITGGGNICTGGASNLVVTLTGIPGFTFNVSNIVGNFTSPDPNPVFNIPASPLVTTNYNILNLTDASGCPARLTGPATVTVGTFSSGTLQTRFCRDTNIVINGQTFNQSNPSGNITFPNGSYLGCDSILQVRLQFSTGVKTNLSPLLCAGGSIIIAGRTFNAANTRDSIVLRNRAFNGCDSTIVINVRFRAPSINNLTRTLCTGQSLTIGNQVFNAARPTGIVVLPLAAIGGCDSTVNISLTFGPASISTINDTLCNGETRTINGVVYSRSNPTGQEILRNGSSSGCDSIINVDLKFRPIETVFLEGGRGICLGDSVDLVFRALVPGIYDIVVQDDKGVSYTLTGRGDRSIFRVGPTSTTNYNIISGRRRGSLCNLDLTNPSTGMVTVGSYDALLTLSQFNAFNISCGGKRDGSITLSLQGSFNPPVTALWQDQNTNINRTNLPAGNYSVVLTDAAGCRVNKSVILTEPSPVLVDFDIQNPLCSTDLNGEITINSINGGTLPFTLQLGNRPSLSIVSPITIGGLPIGKLGVVLKDANGCGLDTIVDLIPQNNPIVDLGPDRTITLGDSTQLIAIPSFSPDSIFWNPNAGLSCKDCLEPYIRPGTTTTYTITVFDDGGCSATDEIRIRVDGTVSVFVPDAFSPNGDGNNDFFYVYPSPMIKKVKVFHVFDRWGELVFKAENYVPNAFPDKNGWDGMFLSKLMNPAVYVALIKLELLDGTEFVIGKDVLLTR